MIGILFFGCLAGLVIVIVLLSRVNSLSSKITAIEWELERLKKMAPPPPTPPAIVPSPVVSPVSVPVVSPVPAAEPPTPVSKIVPERTPSPPSRTREEWETFVGGKLLNRIGALALIIGMGFFLKYAFDNDWITETMRVVIGVVAGAGVLLLAGRAHRKGFEVFAQGLFGAGISVLYLSVYAAFNFYSLIPQSVAFVCMFAVTATAMFVAIRYNSVAISILAWAGGFLTPFLLATGEANEVGLFSYILILDIGLLGVAFRKEQFSVLEILTLPATYFVYLSWFDRYYTEEKLGVAILFLTLFWALFSAVETIRAGTSDRSRTQIRHVAAYFNISAYYLLMYSIIEAQYHDWMGAVTVAIGTVYFALAMLAARRSGNDAGSLTRNIFTGIVLCVIATAVQFTGFTTAIFWSIEAAILVWCGVRYSAKYVSVAGALLLALSLLKLLSTRGAFAFRPVDEFVLLFNYRAVAYLICAIAIFWSATLFRKQGSGMHVRLHSVLDLSWVVVVFLFITIEANDWFRLKEYGIADDALEFASLEFGKMMTLICCWTFYSADLAYGGMKLRRTEVVVSALIVFTVALMLGFIRGIAFSPIEEYQPLLNVRTLAGVILLGGAYYHYYIIAQQREAYAWAKEVQSTIAIGATLFLLWLLTGETRDIFERQLLSLVDRYEITDAENLKQLSLSALWLVYGMGLMIVGIMGRSRGLRFLSIGLLGFSVLKIFVYDLSFLQTLYRIFSFIGLGVILLAASYLYQKYKSLIVEPPPADGT